MAVQAASASATLQSDEVALALQKRNVEAAERSSQNGNMANDIAALNGNRANDIAAAGVFTGGVVPVAGAAFAAKKMDEMREEDKLRYKEEKLRYREEKLREDIRYVEDKIEREESKASFWMMPEGRRRQEKKIALLEKRLKDLQAGLTDFQKEEKRETVSQKRVAVAHRPN